VRHQCPTLSAVRADRSATEPGRPTSSGESLLRAALSGARYATAGLAASALLLLGSLVAYGWYTGGLTTFLRGHGGEASLIIGAFVLMGLPVALVLVAALGAAFGVGNALLATTRWGRGRAALVAKGVAVGGGAAVLLVTGIERHGLTALAVVCLGTSCALHLRRQQRLRS
jgi:hypothetical protein